MDQPQHELAVHRRRVALGTRRRRHAAGGELERRVLGAHRAQGFHLDRVAAARAFLDHAVTPTVRPSILSVGCPTPTGTLCPSLPQVPMPESSSRSLPIMLTRVSTSGPLPIRVAPFTGWVTLPFSMR